MGSKLIAAVFLGFFLLLPIVVIVNGQEQQPKYLTLDEMQTWEVCAYVKQLSFLLSQIWIYRGEEPTISASRPVTEYETRIINKTQHRVKELIHYPTEDFVVTAENVSNKIYNECMEDAPL